MKVKALLFASSFVAAQWLTAADAPAAAGGRADGTSRPPAGFGGALSGVGGFERVLTEEQRKKLREYTQASSVKTRESQQEAIKLRRELQEAVMAGSATEATIKQKTETIAKLESEVLAGRMLAMSQIAATLTPEQKEKIKQMSEQMRSARPGLGAGPREGDAPRGVREPAAPPPPAK
jgi:Spy/CpxP family protein refolding chaperone